jgi:DNA-binding NarL/FixJ family response regulator
VRVRESPYDGGVLPSEPHSPGPGELIAAGGVAYVDDRFDEARAQWEQAFRALHDVGASAAAARVATLLGELHWGGLGNASIGRGWLERARRLLDDAGPCVEWGYWELARLACDRPDIVALEQAADRALALAIEYADTALQTRALADGGFARVCQGRLTEGFARLDEALAALTGGEVTDPFAVSTSWCALLSACDRAGDPERAREWLRAVQAGVLGPADGRPRMLGAHCQIALGGVLCSVGRLVEAEEALSVALEPGGGATFAQRVLATARLAELRVRSGRLDEAAELLATIADVEAAVWPLALLHVARNEFAEAIGVLRRGLEAVTGDVLRQAQWLSLLVEAQLATPDAISAAAATDRLRQLAEATDSTVVGAYAALASGRIAAGTNDLRAAAELLASAERRFDEAERPVEMAQARLARAEAIQTEAPFDAVGLARAVHATAVRHDLPGLRDRSAALLRRLGATPPRNASASNSVATLTAREVEILDGLRQGDSNAQIAGRLFLSPKTVEHHVSRIFVKLGVRTRAEAAAVAASAGPLAGG